jgi:SAM-dependent methyltransferase
MERGHGPIARRVFDSLQLPEDAHYLDIGCGNGYSVRWAAAAAPRGQAVGIDLSPEMIRRARELSVGIPNAVFMEKNFPYHELPFGSFDAVFSMEALYYISDPTAALREILRLLKPGGTFVSAIDYYAESRASYCWSKYVGVSMRMWSGTRWRHAFGRAGFTAITQGRMIIPREDAVESWHASVGCLVTTGRRPPG